MEPLPDDEAGPPRPRPPLPEPTAVRRLGLRLFLLSLSAFFAAGLVAFAAVRWSRPGEAGSLPASLWLSTVLLLLAGMAMEAGSQHARRARLPQVGRWLGVALGVGLLFAASQAMALTGLLRQHHLSLSTRSLAGVHGLVFCLVLIHAVHALGGMGLLAALVARAAAGRLSLEHLPAVRSSATYWHFLEVVWVVMLATFLALG